MKWIPSQSLNFGIICFTEKLTNIINDFQIGVFPDSLAAKSDLQLYFHGLVVKIRMWKNLGDFFFDVRRTSCFITSLPLTPFSVIVRRRTSVITQDHKTRDKFQEGNIKNKPIPVKILWSRIPHNL